MNSKSGILLSALAVAFLFSSSVLCSDFSGNSDGTDNLNWKADDKNKSAIASFRDIDVARYGDFIAPEGRGAYANRPYLEIVKLPSTLEEIGEYSFAGCPKLKTIIINNPSHLKIIGDYAFAGSGFEYFKAPSTVEYIGDYAFAYSNHLQLVDIPRGAHVSPTAFDKCCKSPKIRYY